MGFRGSIRQADGAWPDEIGLCFLYSFFGGYTLSPMAMVFPTRFFLNMVTSFKEVSKDSGILHWFLFVFHGFLCFFVFVWFSV